MGYLLIFFNLLIGSVGTVLRKSYVKKSMHISTANSLYILLAHPIAAVYFFIMAKGNVPLNIPTLLFSIAYGFCSMASVVLSFRAYQETNLVYMTVFRDAGAFIIPFFFELLFWKESFSLLDFVCVLLRTVAIFIPLFFDKGKRKGLTVCMLLFLLSAFSRLVTKAYAVTPGVLSDTTWFFWTNIMVMPMALIIILQREGIGVIKRDIASLKPVMYIYIMANTAISNITSIVAIQILRILSATTSSVISSALGMVMTIMLSTIFYREDIKKPTYISAAMSVAAGILSVL